MIVEEIAISPVILAVMIHFDATGITERIGPRWRLATVEMSECGDSAEYILSDLSDVVERITFCCSIRSGMSGDIGRTMEASVTESMLDDVEGVVRSAGAVGSIAH